MMISEYLDRYLDINPVGYSKINKKKYENNVDKDFPGLRKLINTLSYYNEVIKYKKNITYQKVNLLLVLILIQVIQIVMIVILLFIIIVIVIVIDYFYSFISKLI